MRRGHGLILSALILVTACTGVFDTYSGTEVCAVCRLGRAVTRSGGYQGRIISEGLWPNACSRWVAEQDPAHEHTWHRTGCWSEPGGVIAEMASPYAYRVPESRWLELLQAATPGERERLERLAVKWWQSLTEEERAEIDRLRRPVGSLQPDGGDAPTSERVPRGDAR